jgi:zinc and cadmium transporter
MESAVVYAFISVIAVSLISVIAAIPFFIAKKISKRVQLFLLSLSVGALLGVVFLDFVPEMLEHGYNQTSAVVLISGVLVFFIIERLIHNHHSPKYESSESGHGHAYHIAPINIMGDAIHNFLDGIVIGSTFLVSTALGVSASISILIHEIPQELADFGIILYAGYSKKKALLLNFLSALAAVVGVVAALVLTEQIESFSSFVIPFAAGNFIYIAAANLLPQLHRHCSFKDTVEHIFAIILGVGLILAVSALGLAH